jgi:hypothetical protein
MIHYSCDRCKCEIDAKNDLRYIVRIEIEAAMDRDDCELADEIDHLMELDETLGQIDEMDDEVVGADIYEKKRYDLCADCYRHYIKNPLGRELTVPFGFSKN